MALENERLENLISYEIMDTEQDSSFDSIVQLASFICGTPIALVTLLDSERQWFKANVGLEGVSQTPRNISFCTHAIKGSDIFEVSDAALDERFKENPLVTDAPGIRFYAGAPLRSPEGFNLGTICVIDRQPKKLTAKQTDALRHLSKQVVELIQLRKVNKELSSAKKTLEEQQDLLIKKARAQTIGELAGGICHQINNPLAIIVGRSMILKTLVKSKLPEDQELLNELDVIDSTSLRVAGILKALRAYSREHGGKVSAENLADITEEALTLLRSRIKTLDVNVQVENEDDCTVLVNKNQLSQAIIDLLNNSLDAMEESPVKNMMIKIKGQKDNVVFTVSDTGSGISDEYQEKIFEAFFTTKSRHFGVGLFNAANFIHQNKGEIKVVKLKGPTTFSIMLPKPLS